MQLKTEMNKPYIDNIDAYDRDSVRHNLATHCSVTPFIIWQPIRRPHLLERVYKPVRTPH